MLALRGSPCTGACTVHAQLPCPAALSCCNMLQGSPHVQERLRNLHYVFPAICSQSWCEIKHRLHAPWLQSMAAPSHGGAEPDSRSLQVCYMRASDALQELYANLREDQLMLLQVATAIWRKVRGHLMPRWAESCAACWLTALSLQRYAHRCKLVWGKACLSGWILPKPCCPVAVLDAAAAHDVINELQAHMTHIKILLLKSQVTQTTLLTMSSLALPAAAVPLPAGQHCGPDLPLGA